MSGKITHIIRFENGYLEQRFTPIGDIIRRPFSQSGNVFVELWQPRFQYPWSDKSLLVNDNGNVFYQFSGFII